LTAADLDSLSTLSISRSASPSSSSGLSFMEDLDQGTFRASHLMATIVSGALNRTFGRFADVVQTWRGREVRVLFSISTRYVQAGDYSAALRILTSLLPLYPKVTPPGRPAGVRRCDLTLASSRFRTLFCCRPWAACCCSGAT
jgi:hypothetical protein